MSDKAVGHRTAGEKGLAALEQTLGHRFARIELLEQALTHSSHAHESFDGAEEERRRQPSRDNEQLEFLGDSVLAFVTSRSIFERYPRFSEGQLSKTRAHLVSARHLVQIANDLNLGAYLRLGRGEERSGGRLKAALLVNTLEAVVAALYLDGGLEVAGAFILKHIVQPELERMDSDPEQALAMSDQKSALQEWLQSVGGPSPVYRVVREDGPDHDKTFTVEVEVRVRPGDGSKAESLGVAGQVIRAQGRTKKKAEQNAAQSALNVLRSQKSSIQE